MTVVITYLLSSSGSVLGCEIEYKRNIMNEMKTIEWWMRRMSVLRHGYIRASLAVMTDMRNDDGY